MTGDVEKFENIEEYDGGCVRIGNDAPCFVKEKGFLVAQLNNIGHQLEFLYLKVNIYDAFGKLIAIND